MLGESLEGLRRERVRKRLMRENEGKERRLAFISIKKFGKYSTDQWSILLFTARRTITSKGIAVDGHASTFGTVFDLDFDLLISSSNKFIYDLCKCTKLGEISPGGSYDIVFTNFETSTRTD